MGQIKNLKDAFFEELKELYNAEKQLMKALPKIEAKATHKELKSAIIHHIKETSDHVVRLDQIGGILGFALKGKTCPAMKGLIEECTGIIERNAENKAVIDVLLIGSAQRVEHYEIAAYSTAIEMAKELREEEVVKILKETLSEEETASKMLRKIATGGGAFYGKFGSRGNVYSKLKNVAKRDGCAHGCYRATIFQFYSFSCNVRIDKKHREQRIRGVAT